MNRQPKLDISIAAYEAHPFEYEEENRDKSAEELKTFLEYMEPQSMGDQTR